MRSGAVLSAEPILLMPCPLLFRFLFFLLVATGGGPLVAPLAPLAAQNGAQRGPTLEEAKAQYEQLFAAAVESSDRGDLEPFQEMQAWGTVSVARVVLEATRNQEAGLGQPDGAALHEEVMARWQKLRPEHPGPHVMRALRIQDLSQRSEELLRILGRFPGDSRVIWYTAQSLRGAGETERATELLEEGVVGSPANPDALRHLASDLATRGETTRLAETLEAWAEIDPGDARIARSWLSAGLDRHQPERTLRLLDTVLGAEPDGSEAAGLCARLAQRDGPHQAAGHDCLVRLAAADDETVRLRAAEALANLALAEGDASALARHLRNLDPKGKVSALTSAARALDVPEQCTERITLLQQALAAARPADRQHQAVASGASVCRDRREAQELFLSALGSASTKDVSSVVSSWVVRVNGRYNHAPPHGTAGLLEGRLESADNRDPVYRALQIVYEAGGDDEALFGLRQRWYSDAPGSVRGKDLVELAWAHASSGAPDVGLGILERSLETGFSTETADALWQMLALVDLDAAGASGDWAQTLERAETFAGELLRSGQPDRVAYGHLLSARGALAREDHPAAHRHYQLALTQARTPRKEWATELLRVAGHAGTDEDAQALADLAVEVCDTTRLGAQLRGRESCARELLRDADLVQSALRVSESRLDGVASPEQLKRLLYDAQEAGDLDLAHRAGEQLLDRDPLNADHWVTLAVFLQKQGLHDDLEALLDRARTSLDPVPVDLLRAAGRSRTARGLAEEAVEVLNEARAAMPASHDPAWIDYELRQANAALGRLQSMRDSVAARSTRQTLAAPPTAAEVPALPENAAAAELLAAGELLRSGRGGRYDPEAGQALVARAASTGDALAAYRLALLTSDARHVSPAQQKAVEALAADGHGYALYVLGTASLIGVVRPPDSAQARRLLERAAEHDEPWAHHNLAYMMQTGQGYPRADAQAAQEAYRLAAQLGSAPSQLAFANLALASGGSDELCAEGVESLHEAATVGHAQAAHRLGKELLYGGPCTDAETGSAMRWLELAQSTGDPGASYDLGLALLDLGDPADGPRAVSLIEELARRPDALALETLSFVYAVGVGTKRSPSRSREWHHEALLLGSDGWAMLRGQARFPPFQRILRAGLKRLERWAAAGDADAQVVLADALLHGPYLIDSRAVRERGARLAGEAAAAGDPRAMRVLATSLRQGNGVAKDANAAADWYAAAAELGEPMAMYEHALTLLEGKLVQADTRGGMAWLERAASLGQWQAMGELGRVHAEGRYGHPRDPTQAEPWKRRRAELGDQEARGWLQANGYSAP